MVKQQTLETPQSTVGNPVGNTESVEGWACSCGFETTELNKFKAHQLATWKEREAHQSLGRINLETREVLMPPAKDRTPEQWAEAKKRKKSRSSNRISTASKAPAAQRTESLTSAMQISFVPKVYTVDYSPIMRAAQDAAVRFWGWREDMPLGNFLDTVLYLFFKEKGITLAGYIIEETEEERLQREAEIAEFNKNKQGVPV